MVLRRDKNKKIKRINTYKIYIVMLCAVEIFMGFFFCANGRLSFAELKEVQTKRIHTITMIGPNVIINPDGPLNLLRGYIYEKCGFVHNKRFFSPEIEIKYTLQPEDPKSYSRTWNPCILERIITSDEPYKSKTLSKRHNLWESLVNMLKKNREDKYSYEYYRTLLQMFPSVDNHGSTSTNSLTSFLRATEGIKEKAPKFLAALFILSEGIKIPVKCSSRLTKDREKKISLISDRRESQFFYLGLAVPVDNQKEVIYTEVLEIVKFFKRNTERAKKRQDNVKELETGEFLDSLQFLIQAYLFEFIESVEDAHLFNQTVYTILWDMYPNEIMEAYNNGTENEITILLKRCFIREDDNSGDKSIKYIDQVKEIELVATEHTFFPFSDSAYLPFPGVIPCYSRGLHNILNLESFYINIEALLYTFFCCLVYDPDTQTYTVEKMKDAFLSLKNFFKQYNKPAKKTSSEMLSDWSTVVSDLPCKEIEYLKKENKLDSGLFNFFLVVAQITGRFETDGEKLVEFRNELEKLHLKGIYNLDDFYAKISDYIENMLKSLCVSDKIQMSCKCIVPKPKNYAVTVDKIDVLALISIEYSEAKNAKNNSFITLKLYDNSADVHWINPYSNLLLKKEDQYQLTMIRSQFTTEKENFMNYLLIHFINNMVITFNKDMRVFGDNGSLIKEIIESDLRSINKLFLVRKLENLEYKRFVLGCFLSWIEEKNIYLNPKNSILRFTSNILGSVPLNDQTTRIDFLNILGYIGHNESIYPSIKLPGELISSRTILFKDYKEKLGHILYTKSTHVLMRVLQKYCGYETIPTTITNNDIDVVVDIFDCLFMHNDIQAVNQLCSCCDDKSYISSVCLFWFVLVCHRKPEHLTLIKELYNYVHPANIDNSSYYDFCKGNGQYVLKIMPELKKNLSDKDSLSKFEEVLNIFTVTAE